MKLTAVLLFMLTLSGCTASWVRYDARSTPANCPPVVSVTSPGGNITISDTTQCRTDK